MSFRARSRNRRFAMKLADLVPLETRSFATEPIQIAFCFSGLTALSLLPVARLAESQESESGIGIDAPIPSPSTAVSSDRSGGNGDIPRLFGTRFAP